MKNMEVSVDAKKKKLTIVVDLTQDFGDSKSGKTTIVASSEGNVTVPGVEDVKIGLNVYKPKG